MSNTIYIDASTTNAIKINETNNRFTYRLPNAIELPNGTEIALQNSIINLKGITGASIEIEQDIEERMIYQYYSMDTSYMVPTYLVTTETASANNYQILIDHGKNFNRNREFQNVIPDNDLLGVPYIDQTNNALAGYCEVPMPLLSSYTHGDGQQTAIPALGISTIKIPKGIYSIDKLSQLISDQINNIDATNAETPIANNSENFYYNQNYLNQYAGYIANNSTVRNFTVEQSGLWAEINAKNYAKYGDIKQLTPIAIQTPKLVPDGNTIPGALPPNYIVQSHIGYATNNFMNANKGMCSVIGVSGRTSERCRFNAMRGGFGTGNVPGTTEPRVRSGCNFFDITRNDGDITEGLGVYFRGWEQVNNLGGGNGKELVYIPGGFDIFDRGIAFGTDNFSMSYEPKGGFAFNYLHQPQKIPTCSKNGISNANPGQECIFKKDPVTQLEFKLATVNTGVDVTPGMESLTTLMTKLGGVAVTNFAFDTARRLGDLSPEQPTKLPTIDQSDGNLIACQQYAFFSEFFSTEEKAKAAWDTTLWSRLGFTYDDLVNPNINLAGSGKYSMYNQSIDVGGFTTFQDVDSSVLSTMSGLYNPINKGDTAATTGSPGAPGEGDIPAINNVQVFNLTNTNQPNAQFSNAIVDTSGPVNAAPFNSSFYDFATMVPVITKGRPYTANKLPTLSKNGYILVTSDIVESTDIMKNQQNDGILDLIPKSNLSNQDYMSDRNILTHTLSNPKSINEVTINILNPDLTDISLEPNTTCLLRITTPIPKPTQYMAKVAESVAEQQVANVIAQDIEQLTDPNVANVNGRIDLSNIIGEQGRGDGVDPSDVDRARDEVEVEQALQGAPGPLPEAPPEDAGDAPIVMPDMPAQPDEPDPPPIPPVDYSTDRPLPSRFDDPQFTGRADPNVPDVGSEPDRPDAPPRTDEPRLQRGEEPRPNPEDPPQREEEVREGRRQLEGQKLALTERLSRLESEHRAEQAARGVAVGRGRKPKAQKNTLLEIKNAQSALDRVEERLRGFDVTRGNQREGLQARENVRRARERAREGGGDMGRFLPMGQRRERAANKALEAEGRNVPIGGFQRKGAKKVRRLQPIAGQRQREEPARGPPSAVVPDSGFEMTPRSAAAGGARGARSTTTKSAGIPDSGFETTPASAGPFQFPPQGPE